MSKIYSIIETKYPRCKVLPGSEAADTLGKAWECIQAASRRKPRLKTFAGDISHLRGAVLKVPRKIPFINICDHRDPFLGIFPKDFKGPQGIFKMQEKVKISFRSYPFSEKEAEIMDKTIALFEPFLSDTIFYFEREVKKIPTKKWDKWKDSSHKNFYLLYWHPLILQEISNLVLSPGDLICDPACGDGELIKRISEQFSQFKVIGSDISEVLVRQAKDLNPSVSIHVNDAQELSYLNSGSVSLFVFCGLLNHEVVTIEEGKKILEQAILKAKDYSYFIITGKTPPLFGSKNLLEFGFCPLLRTKWSHFSFVPFYIGLSLGRKIAMPG